MLLQRSSVTSFHAHQSIFTSSKKKDILINRMGGSVQSSFQEVQRIHELQFLYAFFMLSLLYRLYNFYKDYAPKKMFIKNLCYVNTMLLCLFMIWRCYGSHDLLWLYEETFSSKCYTFTRTHISKELLLCWISAIIRIWYSNFMTSKEAYHSSYQLWQQYLNIFKQHFAHFISICQSNKWTDKHSVDPGTQAEKWGSKWQKQLFI